jgi:hypothetical protein
MGLWGWTKRITTDQTGGIEPISVDLERNPDAIVELGAHNPPDVPLYVLRIGIEGGFGRARAGLPVFRRENPSPHPVLKEIYHCEVAGKTLEAANVYALRGKVQRQLEVIAPARSLPLCYFRAPRFDYSLAVYEEGSHLVCPVLAGPKIKADELAEIREPVVRHMRTSGYLDPDEEPEVLVVRPSDLRQVPPAAVIRCLDEPGLWMPTVEGSSPEGPVIGLLVHPAELTAATRRRRGATAADAPPSAPDVSALLRYIGGEMAVKGRLLNPWSLYAADVRPEIWARTEELTEPTARTLTAHLEGGAAIEVPVHRTAAGESVGALRERAICVFLAGDDDALATVIGRYLTGGGFLRDAADLRPELIREAPPESLDPGAIWTGSPRGFGGEPAHAEPAEELSVQVTTTEDREVETT